MSDRVPEQDKQVIDVSEACYAEIRTALVAAGTGGTIIERGGGLGKVIDMGEIVVRTGYRTQTASEIADVLVATGNG